MPPRARCGAPAAVSTSCPCSPSRTSSRFLPWAYGSRRAPQAFRTTSAGSMPRSSPDPTPWLEGGELLLSTGLGIGSGATEQRAYIGRLAGHRLAGLGFGLGFGHEAVPAPLVEEADRQSFPIFEVPYEVPFIAISKAVFSHLASEQLELVTQALEVHERLAQAVTQGRGAEGLLAVVASHLGCSLALVDESGRVLVERHARRRVGFEDALELPVVADDEMAVLRAARASGRVRRVRPPRPAPRPDGARLRALQAPRRLRGGAASRRRPPRRPRARAARRSRGGPPDGGVRARARTAARGPGRDSSRRSRRRPDAGGRRARARPEGDPLPLDRPAGPGGLPRRDRRRGGCAGTGPRARSSSSPGRASASAGRHRGGRSGAACSRRAPRSARPAQASSRTGISARWSCC